MSSFNPIRRSGRIKPKAKQHKESAPWRTPKIRLDGPEMRNLRSEVFMRSNGWCENLVDGNRCMAKIWWGSFHMHHIKHRSLGGSDAEWNLLALCATCHELHHSGKRRVEIRQI